jgi:competence protein ComEC
MYDVNKYYNWLKGVITMKLVKSVLISGLILSVLSGCGSQISSKTTNGAGTSTNDKTTPPASVKPSTEATQPTSDQGNKLKVIFLDVGQGNAQLIITPNNHAMLIDAGNNDKEQLMLKYMKDYNIKKLDVVVGSHPDADHIGGLDKIVKGLEIGSVYMPKKMSNTKTFESLLNEIKNKGLKINTAKSGVNIPLDENVNVEMLGPVKDYDDSNDVSAVVKVSYGDQSFLFPGDAEGPSEKDMIDSGVNLQTTTLAVGHHGSNSSTSPSFLNKVNPKYAVIQVGADNKYGHPTDKTLQKLKSKNIQVFRTDLNGNITFTTDGKSMDVTIQKK